MNEFNVSTTSILRIPNINIINSTIKDINSLKVKIKNENKQIEIIKAISPHNNSIIKYNEKFNNSNIYKDNDSNLEITYESYVTNIKDENLFFISLNRNLIIKIDNLYDFKIKKQLLNLNPKRIKLSDFGMRKNIVEIEKLSYFPGNITTTDTLILGEGINQTGTNVIINTNLNNELYEIENSSFNKKNIAFDFIENFIISSIKKKKIFNFSEINEFFSHVDKSKVMRIIDQYCFIKNGRYFLKSIFWDHKYKKIVEILFNYLETAQNLNKNTFYKLSKSFDRMEIDYVFNTFFYSIYVIDYRLGNQIFLDFDDLDFNQDELIGDIPMYILKGFNDKSCKNENLNNLTINEIKLLIHKYLESPKHIQEIINEFLLKFKGVNVDEIFIKNLKDLIFLTNSKYISILERPEIQIVVIKLFATLPIIKKKDIFEELKKTNNSSLIERFEHKDVVKDLRIILQILAEPRGQNWVLKK
ncbi:hypothetical protein CDIK_1001 [Cucumispora dikerogammari]|nr:hypothetical protein CDIK_1001 [Cucumispora dikerogammari]